MDVQIRFWKFIVYVNFTTWYIIPDWSWQRNSNYDRDYLTIHFLCFYTMFSVLNKQGKENREYRKEYRRSKGIKY